MVMLPLGKAWATVGVPLKRIVLPLMNAVKPVGSPVSPTML